MSRIGLLMLVLTLSLVPAAESRAQYEGTDAKYREERRDSRSQLRLWKLGAGLAVVVGGAGIWAVKKLRGKA